MRILILLLILAAADTALAQQAVPYNKVRSYLEKSESCVVAFGSVHPIFPGTDKGNPNIGSFVNCISNVTRGSGVNKIEGCAFTRYDTANERYVSLGSLAKKEPFLENKKCDWETVKTLLEMEALPKSDYGPTAGDFLFYGAKTDKLPVIVYSDFSEVNDWFNAKKKDWISRKAGK